MQPNAWITLRHEPPYRSGAFAEGFERLGYTPRLVFPDKGSIRPGDVVVTWNLSARYAPAAEAAMVHNVPLIVSENGYVSRRGSKEPFYALARNGHNGSGFWFVGAEDRWATLGQELAPWQDARDGHILIAGQRGIGSKLMRSPSNFVEIALDRVKRIVKASRSKIDIRVREHPGRHDPKRSLDEELRGCRAVVSWSSNVLNLALLAGVPAYRMAPYHVNDATLTDLATLLSPPHTDRLPGFGRLAWAQWSLSEIETGKAFSNLLQDAR